jgi:hypothetical protein
MREHTYLGGLELTVMLALLRLGEVAYAVPLSQEKLNDKLAGK